MLVLIHGITSTSATWAYVLPSLAEHFTVIAPDLIGHGESAKPRGDYSLGAYAAGIRDLLIALGHKRATFVGHSLGGGVAMQLSYLFPEHCERLVLVSSGGLGREISALLRAASLPGSELVLPLLVNQRVLGFGRVVGDLLGRVGLRVHADLGQVLRGHASLSDGDARAAFLHTLRPIVDVRGQRVDATDRIYLATSIPFMMIWGERDPMIPVAHGRAAHELVPGSRLEVFPEAGHFPHLDDPIRFVRVIIESSRRPRRRKWMRDAGASCCERLPRAGPGVRRGFRGPWTSGRDRGGRSASPSTGRPLRMSAVFREPVRGPRRRFPASVLWPGRPKWCVCCHRRTRVDETPDRHEPEF